MNDKIQVIQNISSNILKLRYRFKTDRILSQDIDYALSNWNEYAEHYDKITDYFESTAISKNPFLNKLILRKFYKQYLSFIDKSADWAASAVEEKFIIGENRIIKKYEKVFTSGMSQLKEREKSLREIEPLLLKLQENAQNRIYDNRQLHDETQISLNKFFSIYLHNFLDRFHSILLKCESPLEEAFFIGMIAYEPFNDFWLFDDHFDGQVNVGNYRLDFAYTDKEKNIYIDIELDGHNYHERTEEQAVRDRQRNIKLQEKGWYVLRFHRKEIEDDLKGCILRIKKFYEMKANQG